MCTVYEEIHRIGIIPVAKLDKPEEDSVPVAGALLEGGIPLIEVTFRADGAPTAIRKMKQEVPNFTVGAGTVLTVEQAEEATKRELSLSSLQAWTRRLWNAVSVRGSRSCLGVRRPRTARPLTTWGCGS